MRVISMFGAMFAALAVVGVFQSWSLALAILNLCLISAVMALGVNIQWGYAGLINFGILGFAALGGVTVLAWWWTSRPRSAGSVRWRGGRRWCRWTSRTRRRSR